MGVVRCGGGDPVAGLEKRGAKIVRNDQGQVTFINLAKRKSLTQG